jgi:glycosyltransferase involved in cell wall biosynthesis
VQWAGQVPPERLAQEYWEADLFLYASLWEGFGLPVLEAFAAGTPVVASDSTSIPEVAGRAAFMADPTRPEELALALQKVLKSQSLRAGLEAKGLQRVKQFTWEKAAVGTVAVYREAFEGVGR